MGNKMLSAVRSRKVAYFVHQVEKNCDCVSVF